MGSPRRTWLLHPTFLLLRCGCRRLCRCWPISCLSSRTCLGLCTSDPSSSSVPFGFGVPGVHGYEGRRVGGRGGIAGAALGQLTHAATVKRM